MFAKEPVEVVATAKIVAGAHIRVEPIHEEAEVLYVSHEYRNRRIVPLRLGLELKAIAAIAVSECRASRRRGAADGRRHRDGAVVPIPPRTVSLNIDCVCSCPLRPGRKD